jgi:hypothetical protein
MEGARKGTRTQINRKLGSNTQGFKMEWFWEVHGFSRAAQARKRLGF